ncbi:MAG: BamA/TamA family outer membrane protein [Alphaproteobacteria bacterium]|nr:BamA/TamA family outer membrane protein [Alphaproteobacteria bacterium]MDE2499464.1 BamA/TamA family outer membrane protein [Alphaproteobacteria bacterium]
MFAAVTAAFAAAASHAANPQPYTLTISRTGASDLDAAIGASALLSSLRTSAPAAPFALIARARGDIARIETVLNSFGYYAPKISVSIAGHDIGDAELPNILDAVPQDTSVEVKVDIARGPLYRLRKIDIEGAIPPNERGALGLSVGQAAVAPDVLSAQSRLLTALQEDGYAFAKVEAPIAYLDDAAHAVDLTFKVETGSRDVIGPISFQGLKGVHENFVRDALTIHPGQSYRPSDIEKARQALMALGVFSAVSVRATEAPSQGDRVPLTFDVQERPRHAVAFSANYSTDLGASLSASWTHRNLLGNAEQLALSAAATGLGGNATSGIGYNFSAKFSKPRFIAPNQTLELNVAAVKQQLDAYSQTAETLGASLRRKYSSLWAGSVGLSATHDAIAQEGTSRLYQLFAAPFDVTYDSTGLTNPLADPVSGVRASLSVSPTLAVGTTNVVFVALQGAGSAYFDLSGDGRSVLALRALVGSIQGGSNFDLPPDQRFYAGGSATVRGFRYQSIGPHFADGTPAGATSVDAGTIEFRQRFGEDWGAAAFVDAGQASTNNLPFNGTMNVGAGMGLRYYTSIGAIRLDAAVPLTHVPQTDSFEIYIGLGQAF